MKMFLPFTRVARHGTRLWANTTRLMSFNSVNTPEKRGHERVKTRIVLDAMRFQENDPAENTPGWLGEEDEPNSSRLLSTLKPEYLTTSDYVIISNLPHPSVAFIPRTRSFPIRFFKKSGEYQPFPPGTRGFLYYHAPKHLPAIAGGLRFRITPRGHPASFPDGHDLHHEGLPWEISLSTIASAVGRKTVLRQQLLNEGLVTQTDLDKCRALMPNTKRLDSRITLYRLAQPFPVTFHQTLQLWVAGETEIKPCALPFMFADNRFRPTVRPYAGSALAQFELTDLPVHPGRDTVIVMRIIKMLTAPTCVVTAYDARIPAPVEGELFRRPMGHARGATLQPWYCDLAQSSDSDSDSAAALRLLVENSRERRL
ncbi:hypothetical protein B0H14DRAFT_2861910 [Mycena olivaceomarginata]|nr:hypothetical protein B0H14DRAFT_2861910 [Mycena olivaceomarginata]